MGMCRRTQQNDWVDGWTVSRSGNKFIGIVYIKPGPWNMMSDGKVRSKEFKEYKECRNWCRGIQRLINVVEYH